MTRVRLTSSVMLGGVPRPAGYSLDGADTALVEALVSRGLAVITDPPSDLFELPVAEPVETRPEAAPIRADDSKRKRR